MNTWHTYTGFIQNRGPQEIRSGAWRRKQCTTNLWIWSHNRHTNIYLFLQKKSISQLFSLVLRFLRFVTLPGEKKMAARIHGGAGAGAATALSTFNPKKLVAPSRTNLPGPDFEIEICILICEILGVSLFWFFFFGLMQQQRGAARDALWLLLDLMRVRASELVTLRNWLRMLLLRYVCFSLWLIVHMFESAMIHGSFLFCRRRRRHLPPLALGMCFVFCVQFMLCKLVFDFTMELSWT